MAAVTIHSALESKKIKSVTFPLFFVFAMKWWDWMPRSSFFLMLHFKPAFSLLFHPHQEALYFLFTFCLYSGIICISEVVDISLNNIDSSLEFIQSDICIMYSAYKLNKQSDSMQPSHTTPFPILYQSVPCLVLTIVSQPAYRFLRRQVKWPGTHISWIFRNLLWSSQSKALA